MREVNRLVMAVCSLGVRKERERGKVGRKVGRGAEKRGSRLELVDKRRGCERQKKELLSPLALSFF